MYAAPMTAFVTAVSPTNPSSVFIRFIRFIRVPKVYCSRHSHNANLGTVADALAQDSLRAENEDQDQHDERINILVVAAEEARLGARGADVGKARQDTVEQAHVGEVAHVTRAERLDEAHQYPAQHRAGDVADAAQHRG